MTQECGACGTHNKYVFCTECGIKLPDEEIDYRYSYPIGPGLRITRIPDKTPAKRPSEHSSAYVARFNPDTYEWEDYEPTRWDGAVRTLQVASWK